MFLSFDEVPHKPDESLLEYSARRMVLYIEFLLLCEAFVSFTGRADVMFFWRDLDVLAVQLGLDCPCIRDRKVWITSGMVDTVSHFASESYRKAQKAREKFRLERTPKRTPL